MKHFISSCSILMLLFSPNLFGQDYTINSLVKDKFALQFQINGLYLQPFQGSNLSCKYHTTDNSALRLGIGISMTTNISNKFNDTVIGNNEYLSVNLNVQHIQYLKTSDDISLYFGFGPNYNRYFHKYDTWQYRDNNWSLGLDGIIGMEWFFKRNMSLSGEYGISVKYSNSNDVGSDGDTSASQSITIGSGNLFKVGLTMYL